MLSKIRYVLLFIACGFFFGFDQFLKWQTAHAWSKTYLVGRYFGWMPFQNPGVAFSIPLPNFFIILITIPIIFVFIYLLGKEFWRQKITGENRIFSLAALATILTGALSNLLDRVLFKHTVDYLLVGTGVINLADVLIVAGFILYFSSLKVKESGRE